ncbi:MAG: hypothetical protein FJ276_25705, partial [Planctomycetes bacterium]|nr:hypothetical protein [Planctomycetota bacterium]
MPGLSRKKLFGAERMATFHVWNRCVRRAFLTGKDPLTGRDYSHRRGWFLTREEQLAAIFAIDVGFQAVMQNHWHMVLRTMPRVAKRWGREEVARRWLTATRLAKCMDDSVPRPSEDEVRELAKDVKLIKKLQKRLCNISWFVGFLCENIARRSNFEEEISGKFFESRFRCRECLDQNAILICALYNDLNPWCAGEGASIETSRYTSIHLRLKARGERRNAKDRADGWLGELTIAPESLEDALLASGSRTGRRASDMGFLPIKLDDYVRLLRWTARQLRAGTRDKIPADLESILD